MENSVGKLAANARLMPARERERGALPPPIWSLLDRKIEQGLCVFWRGEAQADSPGLADLADFPAEKFLYFADENLVSEALTCSSLMEQKT